jgi:hypothetical protein
MNIQIFQITLVILLIFSSTFVNAENEKPLPFWFKYNTQWWIDDKLSDSYFTQAIQWLVENKIIFVSLDFDFEAKEEKIPKWFKKVSAYWIKDEISDHEFFNSVQFLLNAKIIKVDSTKLNAQDLFKEIEYSGEAPLFRTFAYEKDFILVDREPTPRDIQFELKNELTETYKEIGFLDQEPNAAFIVPIFTSTAYWEPSFYTYYRGECNTSCLTKKIEFDKPFGFSASANAIKILDLLGYDYLTDIDVDRNPSILQSYEKIIVLHNEYVTKTEFDAITNHPKVIFLAPNALYAEVKTDYQNNTITLIRGHNYPQSEIRNGFNWQFDNSEFEYNTHCENWKFYEIENGVMLNCYPEYQIEVDKKLLKFIKNY